MRLLSFRANVFDINKIAHLPYEIDQIVLIKTDLKVKKGAVDRIE